MTVLNFISLFLFLFFLLGVDTHLKVASIPSTSIPKSEAEFQFSTTNGKFSDFFLWKISGIKTKQAPTRALPSTKLSPGHDFRQCRRKRLPHIPLLHRVPQNPSKIALSPADASAAPPPTFALAARAPPLPWTTPLRRPPAVLFWVKRTTDIRPFYWRVCRIVDFYVVENEYIYRSEVQRVLHNYKELLSSYVEKVIINLYSLHYHN